VLGVADEDHRPLTPRVGQDGSSGGGDISGPTEYRRPVGRLAEAPAKMKRRDQCRCLRRTDSRSASELLWPRLGQPMEATVVREKAGRHIDRAFPRVPVAK
jgi:hypothetical protein